MSPKEVFLVMSLGRQMGSAKGYEHLCKLPAVRALGVVSPLRRQREEAGNTQQGRSWVLSICNPQSQGNKRLTNKIRIGQHTNVCRRIINICIVSYTLQRAFTDIISINSSKRGFKNQEPKIRALGKAPGRDELQPGF